MPSLNKLVIDTMCKNLGFFYLAKKRYIGVILAKNKQEYKGQTCSPFTVLMCLFIVVIPSD